MTKYLTFRKFMTSTTRRFFILIASVILLVIAVVSLLSSALLFRAFIFERYETDFLAEFVTVVFLPLATFCLAVLAVVMLDRMSITKAKQQKKK